MNALDRLISVEEIKQLKAKYFLGYDTKNWTLWRDEVWAPQGRLEVPEIDMVIEPREAMIEWVIAQSHGQSSVHHGYTPMIEITGSTSATGVWAMEDRLYRTGDNPSHGDVVYIHGFGHYHETYVKLDVGWRIASTRLTRLRVNSVSRQTG